MLLVALQSCTEILRHLLGYHVVISYQSSLSEQHPIQVVSQSLKPKLCIEKLTPAECTMHFGVPVF